MQTVVVTGGGAHHSSACNSLCPKPLIDVAIKEKKYITDKIYATLRQKLPLSEKQKLICSLGLLDLVRIFYGITDYTTY